MDLLCRARSVALAVMIGTIPTAIAIGADANTRCEMAAKHVGFFAMAHKNNPSATELELVRGIAILATWYGDGRFLPVEVELGPVKLADFAFYHGDGGYDAATTTYLE